MQINIWAIGAVAAAAQGLFLSIILFSKKENRLPNRLLGVLLLLLAVTLVEWALWWTRLIQQVPGMMAVSAGLQWLYGPLLWWYFEATFKRNPLKIRAYWHFLPFAAAVFFMLPFYLRFYKNIAQALQWIPALTRSPWYPVPVFAQMIAYGILIQRCFRPDVQKNAALKRWSHYLLFAYWGIVLCFLFYRFAPWLGLTGPEWRYLNTFGLTLFIYLVAWLGYIEPKVFAGMPLKEAVNPVKYRHSVLTPENSAKLFRQIGEEMEQRGLYRDSDLSLDGLAQLLKAQRYHVSQAINAQAGKNFSDYVNEYRVREAQQILVSTTKQDMNTIEVAYAVGFATKNAFNLAFKKHTGMTPSAFRQAHEKKV